MSTTVALRKPFGIALIALVLLLVASCTSTTDRRSTLSSVDAIAASSSAASSQPLPTTASSAAAIPSGQQLLFTTIAGARRTVLIDRPSSGAHYRPLIVFLHGSRNSPALIRSQLDIHTMAARAGVLVAYPEGDPGNHSWKPDCCNPQNNDSSDLDFITRVIDGLVADHEADPHRVVLGGFSAGAFFANSYACRMAGKVRAIVSVAGVLLQAPAIASVRAATPTVARCAPSRPVSVFEVHGTSDPTVPIAGSTSHCGSSCLPGANGYLAPSVVVNGWWRQLDRCAAPVARTTSTATISLATCAAGTEVGLALVKNVWHDLVGLRRAFPVRETLVALALGRKPGSW